ncbi:MAG: hypothetical protein IKW21_04510 [Lachnospiraceae bacterium]|nr:hypothetical protein [Lachnospiraceae bacterium]
MIEAIITGAVAILVCMINNAVQYKSQQEQHNATITLIEYKLDQLTKKVELHNNAVERLYAVEKKCEVYDEKFRVANHRIDDLEHSETA